MASITRVHECEGIESAESVIFVANSGGEKGHVEAMRAVGSATGLLFVFVGSADDLLRDLAVAAEDELPNVILLIGYHSNFQSVDPLTELQADPLLWEIPVVVVLDEVNLDLELDCYRRGATWVGSTPTSDAGVAALAEVITDLS